MGKMSLEDSIIEEVWTTVDDREQFVKMSTDKEWAHRICREEQTVVRSYLVNADALDELIESERSRKENG